ILHLVRGIVAKFSDCDNYFTKHFFKRVRALGLITSLTPVTLLRGRRKTWTRAQPPRHALRLALPLLCTSAIPRPAARPSPAALSTRRSPSRRPNVPPEIQSA